MLTFLTAALVGGLLLMIAALVLWGVKAGDRRSHRLIAGTPMTPIGSWRPGTRRVAGQGITGSGPYGPMAGPVSGQDCAWWQVRVDRYPSRDSDDRTGWDALGVFAAPGLPSIGDGSGHVLVDARVADQAVTVNYVRSVSSVPAYVPAKLVGKMRSYEEIRLTETRLPIGREVFVVGSVQRDPAVLTPKVFTVDRRDQVLDRLAGTARSAQVVSRAFGLAGLVLAAVSAGLLSVRLG
ncbi:hypothetical protein KOI35_27240 [Actinoplanes bogorensis]|uniref:RING-type E3 ubiquitin transferase n=1 Tax=Paractinoplanes bogorensis TaxID=1610840 RepID=A0ABS5YUS9_9ACTN|nr:hypothetical protein [Actinoplanes bogorensis]MBU2667209.1 hypothetical protein [Actinoplanes bogorensis]